MAGRGGEGGHRQSCTKQKTLHIQLISPKLDFCWPRVRLNLRAWKFRSRKGAVPITLTLSASQHLSREGTSQRENCAIFFYPDSAQIICVLHVLGGVVCFLQRNVPCCILGRGCQSKKRGVQPGTEIYLLSCDDFSLPSL